MILPITNKWQPRLQETAQETSYKAPTFHTYLFFFKNKSLWNIWLSLFLKNSTKNQWWTKQAWRSLLPVMALYRCSPMHKCGVTWQTELDPQPECTMCSYSLNKSSQFTTSMAQSAPHHQQSSPFKAVLNSISDMDILSLSSYIISRTVLVLGSEGEKMFLKHATLSDILSLGA